jgi:hypothetical protein
MNVIDNKNAELLSFVPCYRRANVSVSAICYTRCGKHDLLDNMMRQIRNAHELHDISTLLRVTAEICGCVHKYSFITLAYFEMKFISIQKLPFRYSSCVIDCQTPIITDECGSLHAANLLRRFMNISMEQNLAQLTSVGKESMFPQACRNFHPWTTTQSPLDTEDDVGGEEIITSAEQSQVQTTRRLGDVLSFVEDQTSRARTFHISISLFNAIILCILFHFV